jgi:3-oxoacyl-[acyl-carrier protein] reductase
MSTSEPQPAISLSGRVALITGGAGDLGRAVAHRLLEEGARVALTDLAPAALEGAARDLSAPAADRLMTSAADVRGPDDARRLVDGVIARFSGLDILVHAAGRPRQGPAETEPLYRLSPAAFGEAVDRNLKLAFLLNQAALAPMIRRKHGQIVNVSSTFRETGAAAGPADGAARFGVVGFSEALAQEVRAHGIRVFAFRPDTVRTPPWDHDGSTAGPAVPPHPDRIAAFIAFILKLPMDTTLSTVTLSSFQAGRRARSKTDA